MGTHKPEWLAQLQVPLFVSRRRLSYLFELPRAKTRWALDSGGFSELSLFGRWTVPAAQYIREVRQFIAEIGLLEWASSQDWMVEEAILKKTGLTVREHQRRTLQNYLTLLGHAPEIPWMPVLQGWTATDYLRHVDDYRQAGIELPSLPRVGLGSVCRRQDTTEVEALLRQLHAWKIRVHAFGFSTRGLARSYEYLASADSMAWSLAARPARRCPSAGGSIRSARTANAGPWSGGSK